MIRGCGSKKTVEEEAEIEIQIKKRILASDTETETIMIDVKSFFFKKRLVNLRMLSLKILVMYQMMVEK